MEQRHDDRRSKTRTWLPLIQTKKINLDVTGKKVYFISDLHLGAKYINNQHDAERRVTRWLDSVKDDMAELYLLGDILDYWYEYKYVVPRGFVRFFGKIAELADAGIKIHWFIGNHDIWIFDYLPNELGVEIVDGYAIRDILGKRFFLAHGDGIGKHRASFRFLRALFRNRLCQRLYAAIHPRWTIPFAHGWSSHSRQSHAMPDGTGSDYDNLHKFVTVHSTTHRDINYYIFGHFHNVEDSAISSTARLIILGEWISKFSYATFDGHDLQLGYFSN